MFVSWGMTRTGIEFTDTVWNVLFKALEVGNCGRPLSGACGVLFDPSCIELAGLYFDHVLVEGCGNASSGGVGVMGYLISASVNRGIQLHDCQFEANFGSA